MLLKVVLRLVPTSENAEIAATAIRAAIKAYSIAVTPLIPNQPEQCPAFTFVVYLAQ
jgi:hypothetical protein